MDKLKYTGDFLRTGAKMGFEAYDPSPELVEAVNLAILLDQPLLLMGEPGSGKTRLAEAVAAEIHGAKMNNHFFRWDIKSNSKAQDGIYLYDALGRMYDANVKDAKAKDHKEYIKYGKLATAFTAPQNGNKPNVLLIDEIDKADIDFPNDLLLEIEKKEFYIPELKQTVKRSADTIIFITSNRERELPPAFLRRCLYYYIKFPTTLELSKIIQTKFNLSPEDKLVTNAVNLFIDIRGRLEAQFSEGDKKPATSELLEWFKVIHHYRNPQTEKSDSTKSSIEIIENYEKGNADTIKIPFPQALLKTLESNQVFELTRSIEKNA